MARSKRRQSLAKANFFPLGLVGGANEFAALYPDEMTKLGCLTAIWSVVEDSLCEILGDLLGDQLKAEAAFYSTTNHKARRDMVRAVAAQSNLDDRARDYLSFALDKLTKASDARNNLTHGVFRADWQNCVVSVRRRPATKIPVAIRSGVMTELSKAIALCELALGLLQAAMLAISAPEALDQALYDGEHRS